MDALLVHVDDLRQVRGLVDRAAPSEQLSPVGLREIVSGPGALATLAEVLTRLDVPMVATVCVLSDDVPKSRRGRDVLEVVTEMVAALPARIERVVLPSPPGDEVVHADEITIERAVAAVGVHGADALVTVGSGTMADIGKVVARRLDLRHVVVQTAASVNGFADDQSVLLVNGTKRTTPSRWPHALVIDSDVLAGSPPAMSRSGLGDLLSTYTAAADWRLAAIVGFDESYSPTAVEVLRTGIESALERAEGLRTNETDAVVALADALSQGGLAMGVAGRTSPSSGAEHTISHLLEMHASAQHRAAAPHGAQVGAASVVAARLWARMRRRLLDGSLVARPLDREPMRVRVEAAFRPLDPTGAVARECWTAYERKLSWVNDHLPQLQAVCDGWPRYDGEVGALLAEPATLATTLALAGAPAELADLVPSPGAEAARWAVQNCHLMRDRFTVVDLAEVTGGWTDADVDAVMGTVATVDVASRPAR